MAGGGGGGGGMRDYNRPQIRGYWDAPKSKDDSRSVDFAYHLLTSSHPRYLTVHFIRDLLPFIDPFCYIKLFLASRLVGIRYLRNGRELGRVNFRKCFWDCCQGQGKNWPIADRRVLSYDPRNNCWMLKLPSYF